MKKKFSTKTSSSKQGKTGKLFSGNKVTKEWTTEGLSGRVIRKFQKIILRQDKECAGNYPVRRK